MCVCIVVFAEYIYDSMIIYVYMVGCTGEIFLVETFGSFVDFQSTIVLIATEIPHCFLFGHLQIVYFPELC